MTEHQCTQCKIEMVKTGDAHQCTSCGCLRISREIIKGYWIKELRGYGINAGPNGERLEDMEYYALRGYLGKMQMQRDLEPVHSRWF